MPQTFTLSRRALIVGGLILPVLPAAALAAPGKLSFAVLRNGAKIGEHLMTFAGDGGDITATTQVAMTVKLGPVPVYRYRHSATERWAAGRFASLETTTDGNGKKQRVSARAGAGGVAIDASAGKLTAPAAAAPLTHWNPKVFGGPLFNPQDGKLLKVRASKVATNQWEIRGETEIDNVYDEAGQWLSLKGKLEDGSRIEYRRL